MPEVCQLSFSEAMTHQHPLGGTGGLLVTGKCWWATGAKASPQSRPLQNMSPKCKATLISSVACPPPAIHGCAKGYPRSGVCTQAVRNRRPGFEACVVQSFRDTFPKGPTLVPQGWLRGLNLANRNAKALLGAREARMHPPRVVAATPMRLWDPEMGRAS